MYSPATWSQSFGFESLFRCCNVFSASFPYQLPSSEDHRELGVQTEHWTWCYSVASTSSLDKYCIDLLAH
jgi:hypothetical protein